MKKDLPMREKKVDYWNGKTTEVDWKRGEMVERYVDGSCGFVSPIEDEDRQRDFFNNGEDVKRYKFWVNKVCQVLGVPENYWI